MRASISMSKSKRPKVKKKESIVLMSWLRFLSIQSIKHAVCCQSGVKVVIIVVIAECHIRRRGCCEQWVQPSIMLGLEAWRDFIGRKICGESHYAGERQLLPAAGAEPQEKMIGCVAARARTLFLCSLNLISEKREGLVRLSASRREIADARGR